MLAVLKSGQVLVRTHVLKCVPLPKVLGGMSGVLKFARYGLLDDQLQFLDGWFRETLPHAPIDSVALLRADGDMYESTMDILENLYSKVSLGGYVVIDDYGALPNSRGKPLVRPVRLEEV